MDEEPDLLEKEIKVMQATDFEYLVRFVGYFMTGPEMSSERQVAVPALPPLDQPTSTT